MTRKYKIGKEKERDIFGTKETDPCNEWFFGCLFPWNHNG